MTAGGKAWRRVDHAPMRAPSRAVDVGALYDGFDAIGLQYGPGYRTLAQAWGDASTALARLRARSTHEGTQVHPADLDDALCTSGAMASSGGKATRRVCRLQWTTRCSKALLRASCGRYARCIAPSTILRLLL